MTRPLGSTPITGTSQLLRTGPPAHHRDGTQSLAVSAAWDTPCRHLREQQYRGAPSHVPRRSSRSVSRRLHAGQSGSREEFHLPAPTDPYV